jgi:glycosyltransferase involved in cell wall biosynthesis
MPKALLIASNEICYNPRLLKTADCLLEEEFDVFVFNAIVGNAPIDLYQEFVDSRRWHVRALDISKRTWGSRLAWLGSSLVKSASAASWRYARIQAAFPFVLNRSLIRFPWTDEPFDLIVVNLVDNLPFAANLKRRHGGFLIYDSQEYFSGQGSNLSDPLRRTWVHAAERDHLGDVDVVLTTTQVMADRLIERFRLTQPVLRVRNAPLSGAQWSAARGGSPDDDGLKLVWHGFAIHHTGRGVDRLLAAIALCQAKVRLTLQGRISKDERRVILADCERLGLVGRVTFAPPAHPERIVPSLVGHDVGVIAETGGDENQRLTSSNKLFEYIHAGLAVIAPDLPGLAETIAEERVGLLYPADDPRQLALCIDRLAADRTAVDRYRERASRAARDITWRGDFAGVWRALPADLRAEGACDLPALSAN